MLKASKAHIISNTYGNAYSPSIHNPHEASVIRVSKVAGQRNRGEQFAVENLPRAAVGHPRDDCGEVCVININELHSIGRVRILWVIKCGCPSDATETASKAE